MYSHRGVVWNQFKKKPIAYYALAIILCFIAVGIYAPFLTSSKPLIASYDGRWYFPLFRYLFYSGFFTKRLDIFYNILIFTLPLAIVIKLTLSSRIRWIGITLVMATHIMLFVYFGFGTAKDPAGDATLSNARQHAIQKNMTEDAETGEGSIYYDWDFELKYMMPYEKLNRLLQYRQCKQQHDKFNKYAEAFYEEENTPIPTLWQVKIDNEAREIARLEKIVDINNEASTSLSYIHDRRKWLEEENSKIGFVLMPIVRNFHWEDDAGGEQDVNRFVDWWELTRINHKDLVAALIFGTRISLVVGIVAVAIQILIGIPIGALAGYYGGKTDIIITRLIEIWEAMPTFFMLLMIVAILQNKSIFLVVSVLGFFGWTGYSRFIRGEVFKQRNLPYVDACHAMGFGTGRIVFSHIIPNAIPPVLTLLPFSIMSAITSEAGLSFIGLGEEGSCSWGVLMDEGRTAFPGESYLLWPPAIVLTILLIAIAIVGDALRDAIDPKMKR